MKLNPILWIQHLGETSHYGVVNPASTASKFVQLKLGDGP